MNIEIKNFDNLTEDEKGIFNRLIEKANKKSKVFRPKKNQNYYFINTEGKIYHDIWENVKWDNDLFNLGNCFETEEHTEFTLEKQKVYTELKRYALEHNEYAIDWDDTLQTKYYIGYNYGSNEFEILFGYIIKNIGTIYFTNVEIAKNAIAEIGETKIKKYLFEVEE